MKFSKPAISIADQIKLLENRGLQIADPAAATHFLTHISYYRLRAYWYPFETTAPASGGHAFRPGSSFNDVLDLYIFDRQLRLLLLDAIERIEVSVRGNWAHHLALAYGPHGYANTMHYKNTRWHIDCMKRMFDEIGRSKAAFIQHYARTYDNPDFPPIWMIAEIISFGQLSKWYDDLKLAKDRQAIAQPYGLHEVVLVSVLRHLVYVRNLCAHHARLWNKTMVVTLTKPKKPSFISEAMAGAADDKLHNTLVILVYLLSVIAPDSEWRRRLMDLLRTRPAWMLPQMGFPPAWEKRDFWKRCDSM